LQGKFSGLWFYPIWFNTDTPDVEQGFDCATHINMELVLLHMSTHSQDCGMALQTPSKDIPAWSRIAIVLTIEVPFAWRRDTALLAEMQEMHDYLDRRPKLQEERTDQTHGDCKFIW
jgi:hypothetical protein